MLESHYFHQYWRELVGCIYTWGSLDVDNWAWMIKCCIKSTICSPPFTPFLTQSICPLSLVLLLTMCSSPHHLPRSHCTWSPFMKFNVCMCIVSFEATSFKPSSFNMQKYTCCNLHNAICCDFVFKSFKLWRLCEIHI